MKQKVRPIIGRIGGKVRLARWIVSFMRQYDFSLYCEPFVGSAAVYCELVNQGIPELVKQRHNRLNVVLNDADRAIVDTYKMVRDHPELLAYAIHFTPHSRAEFIDSRQKPVNQSPQDTESTNLAAVDSLTCLNEVGQSFVKPSVDLRVEWVRRYLCNNWQSFAYKGMTSGWSYERNANRGLSIPNVFNSIPSRILTASPHLQESLDIYKQVSLECDDFEKVMRRFDTPETMHYVDPPYYGAEHLYAHEFTKDDHLRLAQTVHEVEGQVILSYYPVEEILNLYSESDWDFHYKETVATSTNSTVGENKPKRTELLLVRKRRNTEKIVIDMGGQLSLF